MHLLASTEKDSKCVVGVVVGVKEIGRMLTVIILNGLLAVLVSGLAIGLWKWRCQLQQLTAKLHHMTGSMTVSPKQVGYGITRRRVQLAETRLGLARLQQRSQQMQQALRLLKLLRLLSLYAAIGARALLPGPTGGISTPRRHGAKKPLHRQSR